MKEINSKIARGAAWMVAFKLIDRSLGLVSTIFLARLLIPADFGLVAMAMSLIAALQLLVSFSFDVPLIQNREAGRIQFDTAWTFNVLFAALAAAALALVAIPAAHFYHEPRLELVVYLLALGYMLQGFANIGPVVFQREMQFDREFKFLLTKRLIMMAVTIPLAFWLRNYWALVIGQLFGTFANVVLSYVVSCYRPRFCMQAKAELFHTSKWLVINNILQFLNGRAADFLIGKLGGAQALGYYSIAYEVSTLPTSELVAPINRAAFPGYAQVANDRIQLRSSFLKVIGMIALFAVPAGVGIASVADLMVPAVLGWKWLPVVAVMQILALYGVIQSLQTNIGYIYLATGKPRLIALVGAIQFVALICYMVPFLKLWGATGAAWAFLCTALTMLPVNQILLARFLGLHATAFLGRIVRPLAASALMAAAIWLAKRQLELPHESLAYLLMLIAMVLLGALVYALAIYTLWSVRGQPQGPEQIAFEKVQSLLQRTGLRVSLFRNNDDA